MPLTTAVRGSQANPAEDLYTQIQTALTAHSNWEFVEDTTVTPIKYSVWRCKAAGNAAGLPFYVYFARSTAAGALQLFVGMSEDYNASTSPRQAIRPAPHTSSSSYTSTDAGYYTNTSTSSPLLNSLPGAYTDDRALALFPLTTALAGYTYYVVPHNNGINIATMVGTTTYTVSAELFESMVYDAPTNDPLPLVLWHSNVNSQTNQHQAVTTRAPFMTSALGSLTRFWAFWSPQASAWPQLALSGTVGQYGNPFQQNRPVGARLALNPFESFSNGQASAIAAQRGWARGLLRTILQFQHAAGVVTGDTMTVGGVSYVCFAGQVGAYWVNTTAA